MMRPLSSMSPLSAHCLRVPATHRTSARRYTDKWTSAAGPGTSTTSIYNLPLMLSISMEIYSCQNWSALQSCESISLTTSASSTCPDSRAQDWAVWGELLTNMFIHYRRRLYLWPHHIPSLLVNYPELEPPHYYSYTLHREYVRDL